MFLKSDGILVKFPFFKGNVGKIFVSVTIQHFIWFLYYMKKKLKFFHNIYFMTFNSIFCFFLFQTPISVSNQNKERSFQ